MSGAAYSQETWEGYARVHASVTTTLQWSLFREVAEAVSGDVLDCGCGTAKIAALLSDRKDVSSYRGVDLAPEMVRVAERVVGGLNRSDFCVELGRIEEARGSYDSVISIHSYYAWKAPQQALQQIRRVLRPDGRFVLATPNPRLDMQRLLYESSKELLAHPDFDRFQALNLELAGHPGARFLAMDGLVEEVRSAGFEIVECHQRHYLGGVNLLVLNAS